MHVVKCLIVLMQCTDEIFYFTAFYKYENSSFLLLLLVFLKHTFQNYKQILKKCLRIQYNHRLVDDDRR